MIVIHTQQSGNLCPAYKPRAPLKCVKNYLIDYECPLGKGNFSTVYRSSKVEEPGSVFAVKLINVAHLREQKIEHLVGAEIEILKSTNHPNVISCIDVFCDENWCYLFTPFYNSGNLESHIKKSIPCEKEMLSIIKDIFEGLLYLEKSHIVHRDIKSANIFIHNGKAIVADMGFAKFFKEKYFLFSEPFYDLQIGSPPFMPPEALTKGYYTNRTDVWAFGVLLYEIFHGESPFAKCIDRNDLIQTVSIPMSVVKMRYDLSIEMKQMILSCLEIDVEKRPTFSQIEQSWYFQKLYYPVNNYSSPMVSKMKERSPLKNLVTNMKDALPKSSSNHTPIKSPTFNRIKELKSEFKRKISEKTNISSQILIEMERTPKKSLVDPNEKKWFTHKKTHTCVENEEDVNFGESLKNSPRMSLEEALKNYEKLSVFFELAKILKMNNYEFMQIKERLLKNCFVKALSLQEKILYGDISGEQENSSFWSSFNNLSTSVDLIKIEIEKEMKKLFPLNQKEVDDTSSKKWSRNKEINEMTLQSDLELISKLELEKIVYSPENQEYQSKIRLILSQIREDGSENKSNEDILMKSQDIVVSPKILRFNSKDQERGKRFSVQENFLGSELLKKGLQNRYYKNYSVSNLRQ